MSWTPAALHVRAEMEDKEVFTRATEDNQKMWELGDVFEMFLMVDGQSDYIELHVTPNNKRLHLHLPGVGGKARPEDQALSFEKMIVEPVEFSSSAKRLKDGWSVSATIPASVFGLNKLEPGKRLRVAFARYDATSGRPTILSTSASHPVVSFHRPAEWSSVTLR
ncbi:MAG: carbohydrate-binding family 9-like protein [Terrimicrobiaceae bacterium]